MRISQERPTVRLPFCSWIVTVHILTSFWLGPQRSAPRGRAAPDGSSFEGATRVAEDIETTIWQLNGNTFFPSRVNPDGSTPVTELVYSTDGSAFAITGDPGAFMSTFGEASAKKRQRT